MHVSECIWQDAPSRSDPQFGQWRHWVHGFPSIQELDLHLVRSFLASRPPALTTSPQLRKATPRLARRLLLKRNHLILLTWVQVLDRRTWGPIPLPGWSADFAFGAGLAHIVILFSYSENQQEGSILRSMTSVEGTGGNSGGIGMQSSLLSRKA